MEIVKESNAMVQARYDLSATELNIIILLLHAMKQKGFSGRYFDVDLQKLQSYVPGVKFHHVKQSARKLMTSVFEVKSADKWIALAFISSMEYKKSGSPYLEIGVDPKVMPYYQDLEQYTTFQLETALKVSSKYTKRLYQILSQFKNTGYYVVRIQDLKRILGLIDEKTGKEQYKSFTLFKDRVLETAKKELQKEGDLSFTYRVQDKAGKKVLSLYFEIFQEKIPMSGILESQLFGTLTNEYQLADWQARIVLARVPTPEIEATLKEIVSIYRSNPASIRNLGGYTAKVFSNNFNLDFPKINKEPDQSTLDLN
jgi:plasmid replication initiation protein